MFYSKPFTRYHFVLHDEDDIARLKAFVETENVRRYAYIKHARSSDNKPHYHFYIELKIGVDELRLEKLTDVPCYRASPLRGSENDIVGYMLKGFTVEDLQSGIFKTNIPKFTCYNGA